MVSFWSRANAAKRGLIRRGAVALVAMGVAKVTYKVANRAPVEEAAAEGRA